MGRAGFYEDKCFFLRLLGDLSRYGIKSQVGDKLY